MTNTRNKANPGRPGVKVQQLDPKTREVLATFASISFAADAAGVTTSVVRKIISNDKPSKGLLFAYVEPSADLAAELLHRMQQVEKIVGSDAISNGGDTND